MKRYIHYILLFIINLGLNAQQTINQNNSSTYSANGGTITSFSDDQNYILTRSYTQENESKYLDQIVYFDALGRLMQTVQRGITPDSKDLVTIQEYDPFGREANSWLPGKVTTSNNGAFIDFAKARNYIKASNRNDAKPFSEPVYEASPLHRVLEKFGPGQEWYENKKSIKTNYRTNNVYECFLFTISGSDENPVLWKTIYYNNGELYVSNIKNEDDNITYEYRDKQGQVVLIRQINDGQYNNTYYVYDDFGNLRYVIPPIASDLMVSLGNFTLDDPILSEYAYLYRYDYRNRCIAKRLPGCDWIFYAYDKADQLIFTQDGEKRDKGEWLFSIPDALGRPALSGICNNPLDIRNSIVKAEYTGSGTYKGYTLKVNGAESSSFTVSDLLSVNYYDSYRFITDRNLSGFNYDPSKEQDSYGKRYNVGKGYEAKGMLTGSMTSTFGDNTELYSVMYYDDRARLIQSHSRNHLGGMESEYFAYNFTGQPVKKLHTHVKGSTILNELYTYTYDHAGRLIETAHKLGDLDKSMIIKNEYDELGRLGKTSRIVK